MHSSNPETPLGQRRFRSMFKKFLHLTRRSAKAHENSELHDYDPTQKLTEKYCIHGKNTSQISIFQDQLLKTELTDEHIFFTLKKELNQEKLLEDIIDIESTPNIGGSLNLGKCILSYLIRNIDAVDVQCEELLLELDKALREKVGTSDVSTKHKLEASKEYIHYLRKSYSGYLSSEVTFGEDDLSNFDGTGSSSEISDISALKCLDKFQLYPLALDQYGNRIDSLKRPQESVNKLLVRLALAVHSKHEKNFEPESLYSSSSEEQAKQIFERVKDSDLIAKTEVRKNYEGESCEEYTRVSETESINNAHFNNKKLKNLIDTKRKVKDRMIAEDALLSEIQKLNPDTQGWKNQMKHSFQLFREGNEEFFNHLSQEIDKSIKKMLEDEERTKVKYWHLLNDSQEKVKKKLKTKKVIQHEEFKNKKYTYRNINEFMYSRDYDEKEPIDSSGEESELPYEEFSTKVHASLEDEFSPQEVAELQSFFYCFPSYVNKKQKQASKIDILPSVLDSKMESYEILPLDPPLDTKEILASRISQVRGKIVQDSELLKRVINTSHPFGSDASRGLRPIPKFKKSEKAKRTYFDEVERKKYILGTTKKSPKSTNEKNQPLSKRLCDRPIKLTSYNWEPPKILGQQVLPGTDMFIKPPKIIDLKKNEDSWKYNLPPFDYMHCGMPADLFELTANQILQKDILEQELLDFWREDFEDKKKNQRTVKAKAKHELSKKDHRSVSQEKTGNPSPSQYYIQRWPKQMEERSVSRPEKEANDLVTRMLNKYHRKDSKVTCPKLKEVKEKRSKIKEESPENLSSTRGIKLWRNMSMEGLKTKYP